MKKRMGFSTCCFPEEVALEEILDFCIKHRFDAMELAINSSNVNPKEMKPSTLGQIKQWSHSEKIRFGLHGPENINFSDLRAEVREDSVRRVEEAILFSSALGIKSIVIHPGRVAEEITPERLKEAIAQNVSSIKRCALKAKEFGLTASVENLCHEKGTVNPDIDHFFSMCKEIGLSFIGVTLDTNHAGLVDGIVKTVSTIGPYVDTIHFSSNKGQKSDHCEPAEGVIDFYTITDFLKGFDGMTIIELNDTKEESAGAILRTRQYLLDLLNSGH